MIKLHFNQEPDCETLCFARRELENYLQKMLMSSTDTEEIIHISMTVSDSPKISNDFIPALDDCFHIYAAPDHIEITASNSRAVLLGGGGSDRGQRACRVSGGIPGYPEGA